MITLTYGLKRPGTGDINWWDEIEDDITQIAGHNHNGINSAPLTITALASVTQAISAAGWGSVSNGIYLQVVTMTSPLTFDEAHISFRDGTTKEFLYLKCVKTTSNTFTIYSNDSSLTVSAVYR